MNKLVQASMMMINTYNTNGFHDQDQIKINNLLTLLYNKEIPFSVDELIKWGEEHNWSRLALKYLKEAATDILNGVQKDSTYGVYKPSLPTLEKLEAYIIKNKL